MEISSGDSVSSENTADIQIELGSVSSVSSSEDESSPNRIYNINNEQVELPRLLESLDLSDVLTMDVWNQLPQADQTKLMKLLPDEAALEQLLNGEVMNFTNPIATFPAFLRAHTKPAQHDRLRRYKLLQDDLYQYNIDLQRHITRTTGAPNRLIHRGLANKQFSSDSSSEVSALSIHFSGCSSETLTDLDEEQFMQNLRMKRESTSEGKEKELKLANNLDWVKYSPRFSDLKIHKNQLTIKMSNLEWVEDYRSQEIRRYQNPTQPWVYHLEDGETAIVAPVCKKVTQMNIKPRDHVLLKPDRPGYLTILCLIRDAASRLPDGVGTRADVCQLARDSGYIVDSISDSQINSVVSGALDRLHYEKDPCVKYDSDRKLWIYLHKNRLPTHDSWKYESEFPVKRGRPPSNPTVDAGKFILPMYLQEEDELAPAKRVKRA